MKTIKITKGNQYDRDGYSLDADNGLSAWGRLVRREDGSMRLTRDGNLTFRSDLDDVAITVMVHQTLADGIERTYAMPSVGPIAITPAIDRTGVCPKCGTYCCGDCESD